MAQEPDADQLAREDEELLRPYRVELQRLARGERKPETKAQEHFVLVCEGRAVAESPYEKAYVRENK